LTRPDVRYRVLVSVLIGAAAAFYGHAALALVRPADDFSWYWLGGRALIVGRDPYVVVQRGGAFNLDAPFLYPLTTAMTAVPFALWLSPIWAATLFVGVSAALLAWGITRDGFGRLPIFGSAPFLWACTSGQMSPLITACALIPALSWLTPAKPNLGLAAIAYRPSRTAIIGGLVFIAASLVIDPHWPREWMSAVATRTKANYGTPMLLAGGPILLLALLRWRRPEARLLLVLACVPQSILFYDQLPLWLIPRTRLQSATLGLLSLTGLLLGNLAIPDNPTTAQATNIYWPMIFATCYLPALAMVMREPNVGELPHWMERIAARIRPFSP
jgi:hypothetical protein